MNESALRVRRPAVAGTFYPGRPDRLRAEVTCLLDEAGDAGLPTVRALIVPHAGYRYSGPIAASGFRQLQHAARGHRRTVYLLGPAHYVPVRSIALAPFDRFATPLGQAAQNAAAMETLLHNAQLYESFALAHEPEHCLEVELPFLQAVLDEWDFVAMLCGQPAVEQAAASLAQCLQPDDLVVVSSDLSHFYTYEDAQELDHHFLDAVVAGDVERASRGEACGLQPILILMHLARLKGWRPTLLDYRNSGDTGGDRWRVVGYAAVAYT